MRSPLAALRALSGRIVIAFVVCALLMGAAVFRINSYIDDRIDEIPRVHLTTASASGTATNFLIIGSDSRSFVQSEADQEAFTDRDTTADGPPALRHDDGAPRRRRRQLRGVVPTRPHG